MTAERPQCPEMMAPLPEELLRALQFAQSPIRTLWNRKQKLDDARFHLRNSKENLREFSGNVDAMMQRCGVQNVDQMTGLEVQAFLARLGSGGRKALEKRIALEGAIASAEMLIESIGEDLDRGTYGQPLHDLRPRRPREH